jgi:amino acid adenylation domain-containing protein/FkbM family methyltransferase
MWFLHTFDPGSALYTIPCALRHREALERAGLQWALDALVRRHESLRTTFAVEDGEPVQVVAAERRQEVEVVDLRRLPEAQREWEAQRLAALERQAPFDLERGPLLRVKVITLDDADHLLLFTMHHVISDAWSTAVFFRELEALRQAYAAGGDFPLEPLKAQYADYVAWQRERLSGATLDAHLAYWRAQLAGAPAVIELPLDRPRPKVQRFVGATLPLYLDAAALGGLRALADRHQSTLFMVLLAAYGALLHRYCGETDLVIGTPIALRERPEFEALIGLFVNTLALRVDLGGRPTVEELLRRVRDVTIDAYSHHGLPFEQLVEELQPDRSLSHQPIVQVVLSLQSAMAPPHPAAGRDPVDGDDDGGDDGTVRAAPVPVPVPTSAKFDLTLGFVETEQGLAGAIEYNVDIFDAGTILNLGEGLTRILRAMAADPTQPVAALPLVNEMERHQILTAFNHTGHAWDSDASIVERIWAQAGEHPNEVAVTLDGGGSVSYRELLLHADDVARRLRARGVAPGELVPVCVLRSADMLAALLGVMRAGAAYVPLDPDHPRARIELMVRGIGARVAVVAPGLEDRLAEAGVELLSASREPDGGGEAAAADEPPFPSLDQLAYAIFTSGSTGTPKCAANPHGAVLNRLLWMQQVFPLGPGDRALQKTPYTFDVSVWELFYPLLSGATVVFAAPGEHGDPAYLARAIAAHEIAIVHFVPSMLRAFLEHPLSRRCASLRWVVASGEALPPDVVATFHARMTAELHNLYGPTECAVDVTHWPCPRGFELAVVPIGYPIANLRTHVLDPLTLEPVPVGARGELFIAGTGVGRGYVGRPGLTAERFVPDPFCGDPEARMYRSGDVARYRGDGSIEYLGRADHQLKVRGFRIEAGEVEAALRGHPAIVDVVVTARSDWGDGQRLVAHCVPDPAAGRVVRALVRFEREGRLDDLIVEEMANGLSVVARNRGETGFLYEEVFVDRGYLKHGIELHPGSVVFDVGANIGMFSLYAGASCPGVKVYAFEPIPDIYAVLRLNAELYGWEIEPRPVALGREPDTVAFTYYPHVSILSGRYADQEQERDVILAFEENRGFRGPELEELVGARLESRTVRCEVMTVSQVMAAEGVAEVDLLKIDVEKSEHDVLAGIADADWAKIRQVVVEVHEIDSRVSRVCDLLHRHGFDVALEQEVMLRGSAVSMVYGRRGARNGGREAPRPAHAPIPPSPASLRDQLRAFAAERLPEYMVPSEIVWLDALPRLSSGKVDRKALPAEAARIGQSLRSQRSVAPKSPVEVRIAQIWSSVLACGTVGRHESFFELGGHSLLATGVVARLRDAFGVEISLRDFFEDPTVAGIAGRIESGEAESSELAGMIPRLPREPGFLAPLSFTQQRLWFLDRFSPGDVSYTIPAIVPIPGPVDAAVLERSLSEVMQRHEVLRTTFPFVDGQPRQRVSPEAGMRLRTLDVSSLAPEIVATEVHGLILKEVQRPFDLANGPVFRALLIRCGPAEHHLVLSMHHIVSDGWSMSILFRELTAVYAAFAQGQAPSLPELPVQYADFAAWQRAWLTGDVLERQFAYWRGCLHNAAKVLELPTDHARPAVQSTRGDLYMFQIDPGVYHDLAALARRENCTPFMALLAVYTVLLHHLSGSRDVCVGAPIANRRRPELEGLIGFFSNTIVLRSRWEGDPTFRSLLRLAREVTLGAFAHQDMPFEHLVLELEARRTLDRTPLFQVMLILQNVEGWDSTGLTEVPPIATGTSKFDLSLYLLPTATGLAGMLEFCVDLFTHESAARMMAQFCEVMAQAVIAPDASISQLRLDRGAPEPTGAEAAEGAAAEPLHARLGRLAAETPGAPAILWGEEALTYGALAVRVDEVAARLGAAGVGAGDVVGVAAGPSPDVVVALLAVQRLGAAYLAFHPDDPETRVRALLGERARVVAYAGDPPAGAGALPLLELGGAAPPVGARTPSVAHPAGPGAPAALVPTWGAEGPRLAVVDRRSLAWRLESSPLAAHAGRRIAVATPPSDDAAVLHLAALYHGACLVLPQRDPVQAARTFSRTLRSSGAEVLVTGPRLLEVLATEFGRALQGVAVVAGVVDPEQVRRLRSALSASAFDACTWILGIPEFGFASLVPARSGDVDVKVAARERARVVTEEGQLAPMGAFGEVAFEGPGLARLDGEGEGDGAPARWRSGVRAIRMASGAIRLRSVGDFLRRAAADVEFALRGSPHVIDAVVALDEAPEVPDAFVIKMPGAGQSQIRDELALWLRPERIPGAVHFVDEFPRRGDGQVDVPTLARLARAGAARNVAPRTELEQGIARIWVEAIGVPQLGIHDDFFVLGGHSLLAAQVVARLTQAFDVDVQLRLLFEYPTIEELARAVEALIEKGTDARPAPLEHVESDGPAPLSFAQQRLWFLDRYEPGSPLYNIIGAFPLRQPVDRDALERAVNEVVRRHEALRLRFSMLDWEPVQHVEPAVHVPVDAVDLRALPAERQAMETRRLTDEIARESFDLERPPLLRLRLLRLGDADHVLLLSIHHIVADGWSLEIFARELGVFYAAFAAGEEASLPAPPIQFTDYARWQRGWLAGEVLAGHVAHWRRVLEGAPPLLELPADHPRPPVQRFAGGTHHAAFAADLLTPLRKLAGAERATTYMVLLAAYVTLVSRYTGRADIVVGTPIANRHRPELAGMIGFVANTLALRVDLGGAASFREVVGRVKAAVLEAYEYQDTPFDKLVEELQPDRDPSYGPLFQVTFAHRSTAEVDQPRPDDDAHARTAPARTGTAKFDFSMYLLERAHDVACEVEYNATLFAPETVARFSEHYQRLLRSALRDPDGLAHDLDLVTDDEKAFVLAAPRPDGAETPVPAALAEAARVHPDRVAVRTARRAVSYGELLAHADRCAAALAGAGVRAQARVAVYVADPVDELVAMLAVLRAGATCVPLSRFEPLARIRRRIAEAGVTTVVTPCDVGNLLVDSCQVVAIDTLPAAPTAPALPHPDPADPAFLGEGGIVTSHRAFAASVAAEVREAGLAPEEATVVAGSRPALVMHDAAAVWISGGTVVLPEAWRHGDLAALGELAGGQQAVRAYLPADLFRRLAAGERGDGPLPAGLRELVVEHDGGPGEAEARGAGVPGCRVFARLVAEGTQPVLRRWPSDGVRPRGLPRPGHGVRVLDRQGRILPVGVPGTIHLVGEEGARAWPVGATGRWLDDGSIEVLGRAGSELSVRRRAVDRGLVESALRAVPGVRAAAVVASGTELRAFIQGECTEAAARAALAERIPAFMLPASIVSLARMPRTPGGEVDRGALAAAERGAPAAPRSEFEVMVAGAYAAVLDCDAVACQEDFLALGGECRDAVAVAARLAESLGVTVEPSDVFLHSTAEALAIALTQRLLDERDDTEALLAELEALDGSEIDALLADMDEIR